MNSIETQFVIQQAALTQRLIKRIESQLGIHGISFSEYMIMYALDSAPRQTMRRIELAEAVGLTASGVTRLLAPMEKIKLVEKEANPRDARVSLVKLSIPGKSLFEDASISFAHAAKSLTEKLNTVQLKKMMGFSVQMMS